MSRIPLHGNYEGQAFVLRKENGDVYQRIEPDTIFGIGQFDSYFAKRIWWGNGPMIAIIKLSGNMTALKLRELKRKTRIQKGFILRPGKGLWATTAGSAHRGIWHPLKDVNNPILIALWSKELSTNIFQIVQEIDCKVYEGGNLCEHPQGRGGYCYSYAADGNSGELRPAAYGKHVRAKFCQIREATIQIIGGTYCIQAIKRQENNGKIYPKILLVIVTANADYNVVAQIIHKMMS
jgi:hypothetical protein